MLEDDGVAFAVRRCDADYKLPARLDDLLEVHTHIEQVKGASLQARQTIKRDGEALVNMQLRLACLDGEGRAARLPRDVRSRLEAIATNG